MGVWPRRLQGSLVIYFPENKYYRLLPISDKARYVNKRQSHMVILYLANRDAPFGKKHPPYPQRNFNYLRGRAMLELHLTAITCNCC